MKNQCLLCDGVVSTRRSLRQHLFFQHLFRDFSAYQALISDASVPQSEAKALRRLISNPEVLWKRTSDADRGIQRELSEKNAQPASWKQHYRAARDHNCIGSTDSPTEELSCVADRVKLEPPEPDDVATNCVLDVRERLIQRCLEYRDDKKCPYNCMICSEGFSRLIEFEFHIAQHHWTLLVGPVRSDTTG